jgi:TetR/AcrR family transcriptional regulator
MAVREFATNTSPLTMDEASLPETAASPVSTVARKRPKPGERRLQILQTLAQMLQERGAERITTAALAARLEVSEAALYRHFASKAQMFEGLLDFIEESVFTLVNRIASGSAGVAGVHQAQAIVTMVLHFAQKNPGMARVMVGDALVLENPRLQQRMNLFFDKLESALKQALRPDVPSSQAQNAGVVAAVLVAFVLGRMQRFVRTGFARSPTEALDAQLAWVLG